MFFMFCGSENKLFFTIRWKEKILDCNLTGCLCGLDCVALTSVDWNE